MGWTAYHVCEGFDRKAECDKLYNWNEGGKTVRVIKSAMVGSTYYAAISVDDEERNEHFVSGTVVLTRMDNRDYCNF